MKNTSLNASPDCPLIVLYRVGIRVSTLLFEFLIQIS